MMIKDKNLLQWWITSLIVYIFFRSLAKFGPYKRTNICISWDPVEAKKGNNCTCTCTSLKLEFTNCFMLLTFTIYLTCFTNPVHSLSVRSLSFPSYRFSFFGSDRSPRKANVRSFVCLFDESLSRALNLHLSLSGQPQVRLRLVSGQSQVSLRCLLGYMSVRLISGRLQEDLGWL